MSDRSKAAPAERDVRRAAWAAARAAAWAAARAAAGAAERAWQGARLVAYLEGVAA